MLGSDKNLSLIDKPFLWTKKPYRVGASLSQEALCSSGVLPGIYTTGGGACLIQSSLSYSYWGEEHILFKKLFLIITTKAY